MRGTLSREEDHSRVFITTASTQRRIPPRTVHAAVRLQFVTINTSHARVVAEICARQGIDPGQLTLHADRGSAMNSKSFALLLSDLGVTKTHSRPT